MAAFGKDRENLRKITGFREANVVTKRQYPRSSGNTGWMRYKDAFKPSTTDTDTIRFIPGDYPYYRVVEAPTPEDPRHLDLEKILLTYYQSVEHYDGRLQKSSICSAGPFAAYKDKRDPCLACDLFWETGGKKGGRISRRDIRTFTIWNYGTFHEIEEVDDRGNVRKSDKTGKAFTRWVKCTGRRCDACAANKPSKKGHKQHYTLGYGHFAQFKDYSNTVIGKECKNCKGRDTIELLAYLCPNCKDAVIDMTTTNLTDEEIGKIVDDTVCCPHCKATVLLDEYIECRCGNPKRAGLFDVDITFKKVITGQGETQQASILFTGHGPVCEIDPACDAEPLDLEKMFQPDPLEVQAEKFKVPLPASVPRQPVPTEHAARPWGSK